MQRRTEPGRLPWRSAPVAVTVSAVGAIAVVAIAYIGGTDPSVAGGIKFNSSGGPTVASVSADPTLSPSGAQLSAAGPAGPYTRLAGPLTLGRTATGSLPAATSGPAASAPAPHGGDLSGYQPQAALEPGGLPSGPADPAPSEQAGTTPTLTVPADVHNTVSVPVPETTAPSVTAPPATPAVPPTPQTSTLAAGEAGSGTTRGAVGSLSSGQKVGSQIGSDGSALAGSTPTVTTVPNRGTGTSVSPSFVAPDYPVVVADSTNHGHRKSGSSHSKSR